METYRIIVERDDRWWMVPELDALTQARRLSEVKDMAASLIALTLDVPADSFAIEIAKVIVNGEDVQTTQSQIDAARADAKRQDSRASALSVQLAKALSQYGVPVRDIGAALGVSFQRASQLVNS